MVRYGSVNWRCELFVNTYVSNLLCHFVGRSKSSDEEKFQLLLLIIKEGRLLCSLDPAGTPKTIMSSKYSGEHVGEVLERCDSVCFCDIPDESLGIHTNKYSKFGMGFDKSFITKCGARPVMYVPKSAKLPVNPGVNFPDTPMEYYLQLFRQSKSMNMILSFLNQAYDFRLLLSDIMEKDPTISDVLKLLDPIFARKFADGKTQQMLFHEEMAWQTQFEYVKVFDESLSDDDPDNYYMEREWRCTHNIEFRLSDIKKIYLKNEKYIDDFIRYFPDYKGAFYVFME